MTTPQPAARPQRPRPAFRPATVVGVRQLSPHMRRVTFGGPAMAGFTPNGPAEHIRVFFPNPTLPPLGPEGLVLAEGESRPPNRVYTPRRWRPESLELDVDFVVHGEGPGSTWAASAKAGDPVYITGPGGPYRGVEQGADWYVLACDEAGLPALGTILDALQPATRASVYVEVEDASEEQELDLPAGAELTWLYRNGGSEPGHVLASTLKEAAFPDDGNGRVWVACEAEVMRDIRRHLLTDRRLARESIHTHGYWKAGAANHPDHDLGTDI